MDTYVPEPTDTVVNVDTSIRDHLLQGELEVTGRLVDASNATLFATCTVGEFTLNAIYKPIAGERPLWDFPDGNLASREYAAYLISELSGWNVVPTTVLRDGPFGRGMVQEWIEIDESIDLAAFFSTDDSRLRVIALFDAVINNTDRKIGHLLPHPEGRVLGCDHGVTFHHEDKLRTVLWQWASDKFTATEMDQLHQLLKAVTDAKDEFLSLITLTEYEALVSRIEKMIADEVFPEPSPDWPAVPWPAF